MFDYEKNYNTKSRARAVEAECYAVRSGMPVQFKSERSCSLTGICILQLFCSKYNEYIIFFIVCFYYFSSMFLAECVVFKERKKNYRCIKKRLKSFIRLFYTTMLHCFGIQFCLCFLSSKMARGISTNQESVLKIPIVIQLILVLLYAPVVEEVLFRYVIRRVIRKEKQK